MKKLLLGVMGIVLMVTSFSFAQSLDQEEIFVEQYIENALSKYDQNKKNDILNNADQKLSTLIRSLPVNHPNKDILMLIHTVVKKLVIEFSASEPEVIIQNTTVSNARDTSPQEIELTNKQQELLDLINKTRLNNGLDAVTINPILLELAQGHADEMAENKYFSHANLAGKSSTQRVEESMYNTAYSAEIIANNLRAGEGVINGWLESSIHRDILLSTRATEVGVGFQSAPGSLGKRVALFGDQL